MYTFGKLVVYKFVERVVYKLGKLLVYKLGNVMVYELGNFVVYKGSLTLAMGKCLWFSAKIKVCQSSLSSP